MHEPGHIYVQIQSRYFLKFPFGKKKYYSFWAESLPPLHSDPSNPVSRDPQEPSHTTSLCILPQTVLPQKYTPEGQIWNAHLVPILTNWRVAALLWYLFYLGRKGHSWISSDLFLIMSWLDLVFQKSFSFLQAIRLRVKASGWMRKLLCAGEDPELKQQARDWAQRFRNKRFKVLQMQLFSSRWLSLNEKTF